MADLRIFFRPARPTGLLYERALDLVHPFLTGDLAKAATVSHIARRNHKEPRSVWLPLSAVHTGVGCIRGRAGRSKNLEPEPGVLKLNPQLNVGGLLDITEPAQFLLPLPRAPSAQPDLRVVSRRVHLAAAIHRRRFLDLGQIIVFHILSQKCSGYGCSGT